MKRLLAANLQKSSKSRYNPARFELNLKAQIDNILEIGWSLEDIILLSNFEFEFMGVKAIQMKFNEFCLSGSKMWSVKWLFDNNKVDDIIYSGDLDCWQNIWFDCPEFDGDVAVSMYSNPKINGGNIFWKPSSGDIVNEVVKQLEKNKAAKEEPLLNKILYSDTYHKRVSFLDSTYNVGCSGFNVRFTRSLKPIRVCHFNPPNSVAWEIHALDREGIGQIPVTVRLERLLRRYYPYLATELKDKSIPALKRAQEKEKAKARAEKEKRRAEKTAKLLVQETAEPPLQKTAELPFQKTAELPFQKKD